MCMFGSAASAQALPAAGLKSSLGSLRIARCQVIHRLPRQMHIPDVGLTRIPEYWPQQRFADLIDAIAMGLENSCALRRETLEILKNHVPNAPLRQYAFRAAKYIFFVALDIHLHDMKAEIIIK